MTELGEIGIIPPTPLSVISPGLVFQMDKLFAGPVPNDTVWTYTVWAGEIGSRDMGTFTLPFDSFGSIFPRLFIDGTTGTQSPRTAVADGTNCTLEVTLTSPTFGRQGQGQVTLPYNALAGQHEVVKFQGQTLGQSSGGGFNASDREMLVQLQAVGGFQIGGGVLPGLEKLLELVLPRVSLLDVIPPDRTGQGELPMPRLFLDPAALGLAWEMVAKPDGLGIDVAAPDEIEIAWLEYTKIVPLDPLINPVRMSVKTRKLTGSEWWGFDFPSKIVYNILPGCVCRFYWLRVPHPTE